MDVVVSHAFLRDSPGAAAAYAAVSEEIEAFMRSRPGFVSRVLAQGIDDPRHVMNVRIFTSIDDYLALTALPDYQALIDRLSEHVDIDRMTAAGYSREFMHVLGASR